MTDNELVPLYDDADDSAIQRDELGRFVKGVTGNPVGRPRGARSRATLVREAIEESLVRNLAENANQLLDVAVEKALDGDKQMLKLILGEMMKPARSADASAGKGAPKKVVLNITQNFGRPVKETPTPAIDAEFHPSEE